MLVAACYNILIALFFTFASEPSLIEIVLNENCFYTFWLVWIFGMVCWIGHFLRNSLAILHEPPIMHASLLTTWLDIHVRNQLLCMGNSPTSCQLRRGLDNQHHEPFQRLELFSL